MPELSDAAQSWLSALAAAASVFAVVWAVIVGRRQRKSGDIYQEGMEAVQRQQAAAQERIAEALVKALTGQRPEAQGQQQTANLSMRFVNEGRSYRLVITNRGPGPAKVLDVKSLSDPSLLAGPLGLDDLTLLKDEEHSILAAPSLATPPHPKVYVSWLDGRGGTHSREQTLSL